MLELMAGHPIPLYCAGIKELESYLSNGIEGTTMTDKTTGYSRALPVIAGLLFAFSGATSATLVQVDFAGTVTMADAGNAFGLSVGDSVTGATTFNSALLTGTGFEVLGLGTEGEGFSGSLTMNMGLITYFESEDVDFVDDIFPELYFSDGILTGFNLLVEGKPNPGEAFGVFEAGWDYYIGDDFLATGVWDTFSAPRAIAVPEPSILALLVMGGLGLLGWRKKAA
ncbi:MAG: PEP-CTERM sorting domain-containing protein [Halomonadaceae bacterium]|nr:MAG: PEP-CTERM sorting domain-containing protein [Halomonadaceae bacterium]